MSISEEDFTLKEFERMQSDIAKAYASIEQMRILNNKIARETWFYPFIVGAGCVGTTAALVKLFL